MSNKNKTGLHFLFCTVEFGQKRKATSGMQLCENLRRLRESKGLSQNAIADQLGINKISYWNYENGKRELPISVLIKLSEIYDLSVDEIIGIENHGYEFKRAVETWQKLNCQLFFHADDKIKLETPRRPRGCTIDEGQNIQIEILSSTSVTFPNRETFIAFTNDLIANYEMLNFNKKQSFFIERLHLLTNYIRN